MSEKTGLTETELFELFDYLDELRESGETNMYGARPYLVREFSWLTGDEAGNVLSKWMKTFDGKSSITERVSSAMAST